MLLIVLQLCVIAAALLRTVFFFHHAYPDAFNGVSPADFPNYYFPGLRFWEGRAVYAHLGDDVMRWLGWQYTVYPADPPFAILLFSAMHLLSYAAAWHLFLAFSVATIVVSILIVTHELGMPRLMTVMVISLALSASPTLFLFKRNHMEFLLLLFSVLGWRSLRRGAVFQTGWYWSVASALKLFPAAWLLFLMLRFKGKPLLGYVFSFTCIACSMFVLGMDNFREFLMVIIPQSSQWYGAVGNYSLVSFGTMLGSTTVGWALTGIAALYFMQGKMWGGTADAFFSRSILASLILSPLSWMNYQILLIPPCIIMMNALHSRRSIEWYVWVICSFILWAFPGYMPAGGETLTMLVGFLPLYVMILMLQGIDREELLESR